MLDISHSPSPVDESESSDHTQHTTHSSPHHRATPTSDCGNSAADASGSLTETDNGRSDRREVKGDSKDEKEEEEASDQEASLSQKVSDSGWCEAGDIMHGDCRGNLPEQSVLPE